MSVALVNESLYEPMGQSVQFFSSPVASIPGGQRTASRELY